MRRGNQSADATVTRRHALALLGAGTAFVVSGCGGSRSKELRFVPSAPVATETTPAGDQITRYIQGGSAMEYLSDILALGDDRVLSFTHRVPRLEEESYSGIDRVGPDGKITVFLPDIAGQLTASTSGRTALVTTTRRLPNVPGGNPPVGSLVFYQYASAPGITETLVSTADLGPLPEGVSSNLYAVSDGWAVCFGGYNAGTRESFIFLKQSATAAPIMVARIESDVPVSGAEVGGIVGTDFSNFAVNNAGDLTFAAYDRSGNGVLFFVPRGSRPGDPVVEIAKFGLDGNRNLQGGFSAALNEDGVVAYRAPDAAAATGIRLARWSRTTGSQPLVPLPAAPDLTHPFVTSLTLNQRGDIAATVIQATAGNNALNALVLFPGNGSPSRLLLRSGEPLFGKLLLSLEKALLNNRGDIGLYCRLADSAPEIATNTGVATFSVAVLTPDNNNAA